MGQSTKGPRVLLRTRASAMGVVFALVAATVVAVSIRNAPNAEAGVDPYTCWVVADSGGATSSDHLIQVDRDGSPAPINIGDLGTGRTEAAVYYAPTNTLYAVHEAVSGPSGTATWGTINQSTGAFAAIGNVGTGTGYLLDGDTVLDSVNFHDLDGLAYDQSNDIMWASVRREDTGEAGPDLLIQIDRTTGAYVPDAFGPNIDFVSITEFDTGTTVIDDIDDFAVDPVTGDMWAVINGAGANDRYMQIEISGGAATLFDRGPIGINDIEGMAIDAFGQVWGVRGRSTYNLIRIDRISGQGAVEFAIPISGDHESIACLTQTSIPITGTIFYDDASNGVYEPGAGDGGVAGVTARLWHDVDQDGTVSAGDTLLTQIATGVDGGYTFGGVAGDQFVIDIDTSTLPAGAVMTTDNIEIADFRTCAGSCGADNGNDFGLDYARGTIGDFVFADLDGDGVYEAGDGDFGYAGITVDLYMDVDGNGIFETYVGQHVTGADGSYDFVDLLAGDYRVDIDESTFPANWTLTTANDPDAVTLAVGGDENDTDFGLQPIGSIGDFVWLDHDGNGVQDGGAEVGLDGVTVELYEDTDGNGTYETLVGAQVTSGGGAYGFAALAPGLYRVDIDESSLSASQELTTVGTVDIALLGTDENDADFGAAVDGSIGDIVFEDQDGDGSYEPVDGDSGIDGVTVELYEDSDRDGSYETLVATQVTAGGGAYDFTGVPPGLYRVDVDQTSAPVSTMNQSSADTIDVALLSGADESDADFGFSTRANIGDFVWLDLDGDGVQDGGAEVGLDGVTVELYEDTDGDGTYETLVASQVTAGGGAYDFTGLLPGLYRVGVDETTLPATSGLTTGAMIDVALTSGADESDADFGAAVLGSIGDLVFGDVDGDGTYEPAGGDAGIDGVTVELYEDADRNGSYETLVGSEVTAGGGAYDFAGLVPGLYRVDVDETSTPVNGDAVSTTDPVDVALTSGGDENDADFGFTAPGTIGELVWEDLDGDGLYEPGDGELGIVGVTVDIYEDTDGNGTYETLVASQTTVSGGTYDIALPPGDYQAELDFSSVPSGYAFTTADSFAIALASGGDENDVDFGLQRQPASIGDVVWLDLDGDGVQDGGTEVGISGVTVELYLDGDSNGSYETFVGSTSTVAGAYTFTNLDPGAYDVRIDALTLPVGYASTTVEPFAVSVAAGEDITYADFGYRVGSSSAAINKINDATGPENPGDTVTYTVVVTNTTGATQTGIDVTDLIPAGTTFVGSSTQVIAPASVTDDYADSLPTIAWTGDTGTLSWPGNWIEIGESQNASNGAVRVRTAENTMTSNYVRIVTRNTQRGLERSAGDLSSFDTGTLSFDWSRTNVGRGGKDHQLFIEVSDNGGAFTRLMCINSEGAFTSPAICDPTTGEVDDATGAGAPFAASIDITSLLGTDTTVRFVAGQDSNGSPRGTFRIDNIALDVASRGDVTTAGGNAPSLATGYALLDGEQMTVTYDVTVDNPNNRRSIVNTASFSSDQILTPESADSTLVLVTGTIGDFVWDDLDGDGVQDGGAEVGLDGVLVELYEDTDANGSFETLVATQFTSGGGAYDFTNVPAGEYRVRIDPSTLPLGHVPTTPVTLDVSLNAGVGENGADFGAWRSIDYGDAPDTFGTTAANAGAAHGTYGPTFAGSSDAEADGVPAPAGDPADSDDTTGTDDEDGVSIPALEGGTTQTITFTVADSTGGAIWVNGWIDFDNDGLFDTNESVFDPSLLVATSTGLSSTGEVTGGPGLYSLDLAVPRLDLNGSGYAIGDRIYVRFRTANTAAQVSLPNGLVPTGEVEDHDVLISSLPVVLSFADARLDETGLELVWETAAEFDNLGFFVFVELDTGEVVQLTEDPILSPNGNAALTQRYEERFEGLPDGVVTAVWIEDISLGGVIERHGPFVPGVPDGEEGAEPAVDWFEEQLAEAAAALEAAAELAGKPVEPAEHAPAPKPARSKPARSKPPTAPEIAPDGTPDPVNAVARLDVFEPGVQQVTGADLLAAGVDLAGTDLNLLGVGHGSELIPIWVAGSDAWVLDETTVIEFVAEDVGSLYSASSAYMLYVDPELARRVRDGKPPAGSREVADTATTTESFEFQNRYSVSAPGADPWYFRTATAFGRAKRTSLPLTLPLAPSGPATLRMELWGASHTAVEDEHHVQVEINGQLLADAYFDDREELDLELEVPAALLVSGENSLVLTVVGDTGPRWDSVSVNDWSLTYERSLATMAEQLQVTAADVDLAAPEQAEVAYRVQPSGFVLRLPIADGVVRGRRGPSEYHFVAAGGMHMPVATPLSTAGPLPAGRTDHLIISHPDFIDGLAPLVAFHEARGLQVEVVDVTDVYRHHGTGAPDANAIDNYLDQAIPSLGVDYVLVVGADTTDYHDYDGGGEVSYVPSLYGATGQGITHAPLDPAFADADDDGVPDAALGRFPVSSVIELDNLVQKSVTFGALASTRQATAVLASGANDGYSYLDVNDRLEAQLGDWAVTRADVDTVGPGEARSTLLTEINGGAALTSYVGHSGPREWTKEGVFTTADLATLTNVEAPTVVAQFGCWNSYYVRDDGLGTGFLNAQGGAAASLGAATLTSAQNETVFAELFFAQLGARGVTIGHAMQAAKVELATTHPTAVDVLLGWTLLGDPALAIVE